MASGLVLPDTVWDPSPATVITSAGGDAVDTAIAWLARDCPGCKVQRTATQSVNNNTLVSVDFTAADIYDVGGWHNPAASSTNVVVPAGEDAVYLGVTTVEFAADTTNTHRSVNLYVNGVAQPERVSTAAPAETSGQAGAYTFSFVVPLVGGDVITIRAFQLNSGSAARNITSAVLSVNWLRAHP